MRVVNDKEEKPESTDFGVFSLVGYVLLTAMGVASILFSPLPMILSHVRLVEPWPKVATLSGALLAILFLEVPLGLVLMAFVFGLFIADSIAKKTPFWRLLGNAVLLSLVVGFFALLISASFASRSFTSYWIGMIDETVLQAREMLRARDSFDWQVIRSVLLYQGPFLYVSASVLSLWLSVGLAAHLGWTAENEVFSARALRRLQLPALFSFLFVLLFFMSAFVPEGFQHLAGGLFRVIGVFMFLQGMVTLSKAMALKQTRPAFRTFVYFVSVLLGFYMVVGIGVFSPWIFRKKQFESGKDLLIQPN